jgi:hypothetical protein
MAGSPPTLAEAKALSVPFGEYFGLSIEEIGSSDEGLFYLQGLQDQRVASSWPRLHSCIRVYFQDEAVMRRLDAMKAEKDPELKAEAPKPKKEPND